MTARPHKTGTNQIAEVAFSAGAAELVDIPNLLLSKKFPSTVY
jgi:hypothetical protein